MRIFNYGSKHTNNAMGIHTRGLTVWFSYETPIAFKYGTEPMVVRQNDWGPTTGKHMNLLDGGDKKSRIDGDKFVHLLRVQETAAHILSAAGL